MTEGTKATFWARGAIHRKPESRDFMGLDYEQASRRAHAICVEAVRTGATIRAAEYLNTLSERMKRFFP